MDITCEIIEKEIGPVIEIEERVPMWKIPFVMGRDFQRLLDSMESQGAEAAGVPYARILDVDWESQVAKGMLVNLLEMFTKKWHFKAGIPTSRTLEGGDGITPSICETKRYVQALHRGPYQKVGTTYKAMYAWATSQGLSLEDQSIEFYQNDPCQTKKKDLETIVLIPLA